MGPKWVHKGSKIRSKGPKIRSKGSKIRLKLVLEAILEGSGGHLGLKSQTIAILAQACLSQAEHISAQAERRSHLLGF
eukprot:5051233-Karenia_brevis.AAC.1